MQVLKFGGSSVANASNIKKVIATITEASNITRTVVVVSAMGGITDAILQCVEQAAAGDDAYKPAVKAIEQRHLDAVRELVPITLQSSVLSQVMTLCNEIEDICNGVFLLRELSPRTKDRIVGYGERLSSRILSIALRVSGVENIWKDAGELITTDNTFGNALVENEVTYKQIVDYFGQTPGNVFILPGFVASTHDGLPTTLGRGGSDYSAALIAGALNAAVLEIWTDVSGIMTADPRFVPHARIVPHISYEEAMELSHFGAKVIYPPTIQPARKNRIPVRVKNTFIPADEGTLIDDKAGKNGNSIRGISSINTIALLGLEGSGMVGIPGISKRLFEALAHERINVILITQGSSEHAICVGIEERSGLQAREAVNREFSREIAAGKIDPLIVETGLAGVAVVGDNMQSHPGTSGKMFSVLGRNGINVRAIAQGSSERNISAVVSVKDVRKAINVLHEEFFETTFKQVNLFIAGAGNVGSRLIAQLDKQRQYLQEHLRLQVHLVGLANSRKMYFNDEGIDLSNWKDALSSSETPMVLENFIQEITSRNLRNSVFADITANASVAHCYPDLLGKSVSVVACNKVACSDTYRYYSQLKRLAGEFNVHFLFETNVGAGLPVIGTLNDLVKSGDRISKIEAVLSGTLNFVFNNYDGSVPFAQVVRQAQEEGYTEPDPRLDLAGTDVMRKIMILARESGVPMEMDEIENKKFMPPACMEGSIEHFYRCMEENETHFKKILEEARSAGAKLKFVARFEAGKASVGLQHIHPEHDFYHLYGKDNVVAFYTDRYNELPLVIKGAGAGAEVTASGVFADIIRASRS